MQPKAVGQGICRCTGCATRPTTIRTTLAPTQGTDVTNKLFTVYNLQLVRTQRSWLYEPDAALQNIHYGGKKSQPWCV